MFTLKDYDWRPVYESQPGEDQSHLIEDFYIPALKRCHQYDRIAGYFNSGALAAATSGIEALIENEGEMRLIVGTQLQEVDRPVLETLEDEFEKRFTDLDDRKLDSRLTILAWLLQQDRLEIKVAKPANGNWGVFHPKVGIFHDDAGNTLSFEGSINETKSGWKMNYERFKVHRSWRTEEAAYVAADIESFDQLWNDNHDFVDVYELSEAIEEDIIEWKSPDDETAVEAAVARARGEEPTSDTTATVGDKARVLANGGIMPGGLHVAEEASTIDPWPHQRVVSDTAINTYPQGFLFCDEVGLGKTVEIGYTLSRLGQTTEIQNSLLLVPAGLTRQWQEELWEKFNLTAYRYDRQSSGEYAFVDPFGNNHSIPDQSELLFEQNPEDEAWVDSPIWRFVHQKQRGADGPVLVIMSWHTARLSHYWDDVAPGDPDTDRTRMDIPASCRGNKQAGREGVWDTVVVDEAHNARRTTNLYGLLEELRPHTQCYYLLTATPMQLRHTELYDLLTLLGLPEAWDDRDRFGNFFTTRRALRIVLTDGVTTDPTAAIETQQTLDGEFQSGLDTTLSQSDQIYLRVSEELQLEDEAIARQRLLTACRLVRAYGDTYDGYLSLVDDAIAEADIDTFAGEDRQLKELLYPDTAIENKPWIVSRQDRQTALDELSAEGWHVLNEVFSDATPVNALLHRNTRDTLRKYYQANLLDKTVADRNPERKDIPLSEDAAAVYDRIDEYTKTFYKKSQEATERESQALGFVMTTYRERLTSSVAAIQKSLSRRLETLKAQRRVIERQADIDIDDDREGRDRATELAEFTEEEQLELAGLEDGGESMLGVDVSEIVPGDSEEGLRLIQEEIEELQSFIEDVRKIELDPKIQQLRSDLLELDKQGHDRVLVFTQYTDTLDYVRDHLKQTHGENVATYSGRGGEMYDADADAWYTVSKEEVKRAFAADNRGVDILVGTEAASEGLNLQECGAVINYDLPWNPMIVEQRIGRVDRIGQEHREITIYHYVYEDTIENDIYDALDERIGMFEDVVGELQPILAGVSQSIKSATLEDDDQASEQLSEQMEESGSGDTVEVRESLTDVEVSTAAEVLENARLEAWSSYSHPDITAVGEKDQPSIPFTARSVETLFTEVFPEYIDGLHVECFSDLDNLDDAVDIDVESEFSDSIYRLTLPASISVQSQPETGTVGHAIASAEDTIAVSFTGACVEEYPSLRFLLPGDPLFHKLIKEIQDNSELSLEWRQFGVDDETSECTHGVEPIIVGGVFDADGRRVLLDEHGEITAVTEGIELEAWCRDFREKSGIEK